MSFIDILREIRSRLTPHLLLDDLRQIKSAKELMWPVAFPFLFVLETIRSEEHLNTIWPPLKINGTPFFTRVLLLLRFYR